jgi:hypothetical protein
VHIRRFLQHGLPMQVSAPNLQAHILTVRMHQQRLELVCEFVCMHVCMHVFASSYLALTTHTSRRLIDLVCLFVHIYVYMHARM